MDDSIQDLGLYTSLKEVRDDFNITEKHLKSSVAVTIFLPYFQ